MKVYTPVVKANARLLSAGRKTIDQIQPESDRIDVYVYAINTYNYDINKVDPRYAEAVSTDPNLNK